MPQHVLKVQETSKNITSTDQEGTRCLWFFRLFMYVSI